MNPRIISLLVEGHSRKMADQDYMNWINGQYIISAMTTSIMQVLQGKRSTAKYIDAPVLSEYIQEIGLTQEEIDRRALEKELLAMDLWIANDNRRGLPKTVIN